MGILLPPLLRGLSFLIFALRSQSWSAAAGPSLSRCDAEGGLIIKEDDTYTYLSNRYVCLVLDRGGPAIVHLAGGRSMVTRLTLTRKSGIALYCEGFMQQPFISTRFRLAVASCMPVTERALLVLMRRQTSWGGASMAETCWRGRASLSRQCYRMVPR